MPIPNPNPSFKAPSRAQAVREAVLLSFCDPLPGPCSRLRRLSLGDWNRLLPWLDTSGLALYFLDRLTDLRMLQFVPAAVLARLKQNAADNTERMRGIIEESAAIHHEFQAAQLSYAMLKGLSLWPDSVPKPWLRSQLDLDFLIAEHSAPEGRRILESRGYRLHAISGRSWEFKTDHVPSGSLKDLYKPVPSRCVELHLDTGPEDHSSPLARTADLQLHGQRMPVLSAADLFLGQGLHLYKHICSEFSRTAHVVEFRRHVLARRNDTAFWSEVKTKADEKPGAWLALGVVTLLITQVMGDFAPSSFTSWTVDRLPPAPRLWVELYGHRAVIGNFPGSKLYLLLQKELEGAGIPRKRSLRTALVPLKLPPAIAHPAPGDPLSTRLRAHSLQLRFIFFRLHFHSVEGLRYTLESRRWRRRLSMLK